MNFENESDLLSKCREIRERSAALLAQVRASQADCMQLNEQDSRQLLSPAAPADLPAILANIAERSRALLALAESRS